MFVYGSIISMLNWVSEGLRFSQVQTTMNRAVRKSETAIVRLFDSKKKKIVN